MQGAAAPAAAAAAAAAAAVTESLSLAPHSGELSQRLSSSQLEEHLSWMFTDRFALVIVVVVPVV